MTEVILVVLTRPERAVTLLNAAKCFSVLSGAGRINVLAIREPIQITGLAAEMLIGEADAVLEAREQERKRVLAVKAAFDRWTAETGEVATVAHWIAAEGNAATIVSERGRAPTLSWPDSRRRTTDWLD